MNYQSNESLKKQVKARILMINEDIKNNLSSLTLEDNFDTEEVRLYYESIRKAIQYEQTAEDLRISLQDLNNETSASIEAMESQISLKVKKADVVTELNAETTGLYFKSKLFLVDTPNFKVTEDSCYVNGTVYATSANIAGWSIENGAMTGTSESRIEGGEVHADSATCAMVEGEDIDLNPEYESTYHKVNMKNCTWEGELNITVADPPNFSDFTSRGRITITNNLNIQSKNDLFCTQLVAMNASGTYKSIYCTEIVTEEETWSDIRLKEDIEDITEEEAGMVLRLRPVSFILNKTGKPGAGLIAQELIKEVGGYETIVTKPDGEYYSVAYRQLIPFMIKQLQINNMKLERIRQHGKGDI